MSFPGSCIFGGVIVIYCVQKLQGFAKNVNTLYNIFYEQVDKFDRNTCLPSVVVPYCSTGVRAVCETGFCYGKLGLGYIEQYIRQNCIKIGDYYVLTHIIEGKVYKFIIKPHRGPILDENYGPLEMGYDSVVNPNNIEKREGELLD